MKKTRAFWRYSLFLSGMIFLLTNGCKKDEKPEPLPSISTIGISGITQTSATGGGDVTSQGSSSLTARGVCWSTNQNPMLSDPHTTNGTSVGSFSSDISGLNAETTYYVRAYASNLAGTAYGNQLSFTTLPATGTPPTVNTASVSAITETTASCGGHVTDQGSSTVTSRGVCWGTSQNPTNANSHTSNGTGTGSFTSSLTGLTASTTYYVRAYATNAAGTSYGTEISFSTAGSTPGIPCPGASTVTDFDGNIYNTVQIGSQCWMKENLKTTHYADGTALVDGTTTGDITGYYSTKYWFVYNNHLTYKATYGLLYTWAAVMNGATSSSANPSGVQGACPTGWHVPSDMEWKQMEVFLGMTQAEADAVGYRGTTEGGNLKATTIWNNPNTGANNSSGFTALPGGLRFIEGSFSNQGESGYWWTATEGSSSGGWYRHLLHYNPLVGRYDTNKGYGFSVRCLRDN